MQCQNVAEAKLGAIEYRKHEAVLALEKQPKKKTN